MKVRILKSVGDFWDEHSNGTSNPVVHSHGLVGHVVDVDRHEAEELIRKGWAEKA